MLTIKALHEALRIPYFFTVSRNSNRVTQLSYENARDQFSCRQLPHNHMFPSMNKFTSQMRFVSMFVSCRTKVRTTSNLNTTAGKHRSRIATATQPQRNCVLCWRSATVNSMCSIDKSIRFLEKIRPRNTARVSPLAFLLPPLKKKRKKKSKG